MQLTYTELMIRKEKGLPIDPYQTVLIAQEPFKGWPIYRGKLRELDETAGPQTIAHALNTFGFLIPLNTLFRVCYLGEKIKEHTTDEKAHIIADLLLINGNSYCPFQKTLDGSIRQI